ncbi:Gp37-like protein [Rummeliibacillus pycnus]|uniref:Gp37-like protein n=1 Tax=Rummeliibacillus pycnus TaxID=101070 RepID=UPI003D28CCDD
MSGLDRYELYVDARDVEETNTDDDGNETPRSVTDIEADLSNRGNEKLDEHKQEIFLGGQILTKSPFKYERDWDLGDIVTVMYKYWGVSMDARITEVKEIYEESGMRIEVVFDKDKPDFISVLKRKFNTLNPVVKR